MTDQAVFRLEENNHSMKATSSSEVSLGWPHVPLGSHDRQNNKLSRLAKHASKRG